jgi:glycine hydroxymethyltransferase
MHVIAAKAVAFAEALEPTFKQYAKQIIANARALSTTLLERGFDIVSGGTDSHIVLVDMRPKNVTGKVAEHILEEAGMTCNKNGIPFDPQPPAISSGIRLGTAAATTRGFNEGEFVQVGNWVADVLEAHGTDSQDATVARVLAEINTLCAKFPIY